MIEIHCVMKHLKDLCSTYEINKKGFTSSSLYNNLLLQRDYYTILSDFEESVNAIKVLKSFLRIYFKFLSFLEYLKTKSTFKFITELWASIALL